jgi:hypothetical protein
MAENTRRNSTGGVIIGSDYDAARTRKMNADAEIAEMELAKIRQSLCMTEDVIKAWGDVLNAVRAKFLALPTKIAPLVANEDDAGVVKQIVEQQIHEALAEMANYDPSINPISTTGTSEIIDQTEEEPKKRTRGRPKRSERI